MHSISIIYILFTLGIYIRADNCFQQCFWQFLSALKCYPYTPIQLPFLNYAQWDIYINTSKNKLVDLWNVFSEVLRKILQIRHVPLGARGAMPLKWKILHGFAPQQNYWPNDLHKKIRLLPLQSDCTSRFCPLDISSNYLLAENAIFAP